MQASKIQKKAAQSSFRTFEAEQQMPEKKYDDYALVCHRRFRKEKKMYVVSQRKSDALGVQNFFLGAPIRALLNTGSSGVRKRTIPKRGRSPIDADRPTSTAAERVALNTLAHASRGHGGAAPGLAEP
jgi:hypothetical protein